MNGRWTNDCHRHERPGRGGSSAAAISMLPGSVTIGSYVNVDKMYKCGAQDSDGGIGVVRELEPR